MNERIKSHVDSLFNGVPHTRQAADVKEELLANLQAKYDDLIASGKSEDEAFKSAVSGIGDIRSLVGEQPQYDVEGTKVNRQKSGMINAIAVTLIILSIVPAIVIDALFGNTWLDFIAPLSLLSGIAIAVGLFIYAASINPKKYKKGDDTFVEEYKEKISGNDRDQRMRKAVGSTLWLTITLVYFFISFITGAWHVTWLIFIIGAILQNIIRYIMGDPKGTRRLLNSTIWLITLVLYFWLSFWTGAWAWTWLLFIVALLMSQVIKMLEIWREDK